MRAIRNAPKRAIDLSLSSKVLEMARELDIDIWQTVDALLTEEVLKRYRARWGEDDKAAIAEYNARIEREGLFSYRWRGFMQPGGGKDRGDAA